MIPDPKQWLEHEGRHKQFLLQFSSIQLFLQQSGLLKPFLTYWIKQEVADSYFWNQDEESESLDLMETKWQEANPDEIKPIFLRNKLRVKATTILWAKKQWINQIETLYLKNKQNLDQASIYFLKVNSKGLAQELYYRLKSDESSFEDAENFLRSCDSSLSPQQTFFAMMSVSKLPYGLSKIIPKLKMNEISNPLRIGDQFCIVKLKKFRSVNLDDDIRNYLIAKQFQEWIDLVTEFYVKNYLNRALQDD